MIIVTGGAGFIGSCFLWKLNSQGIDDIIVVDNLDASNKWRNLLGKRFVDYIQKEDFLDLLESGKIPHIKTIVHLGACTSTILTDTRYFLKNNYEYSKRIALWALAHEVRFMYASSAATYGAGEVGYDDSEAALDNLRPLNIYGYSKHLFDLWLLRNDLLPKVTGFKFFNVFGPNEYHKGEMMSVIGKTYHEAKDRGVIRLFKSYLTEYKDGEQRRDFVYVKDVVEVMYYFFTNSNKTGTFNLGTGVAHSWNDLAQALFAALGRKTNIEYIEMPEYLRPKYQYFTRAKLDKLRKAGCDYTFGLLEDSIHDYVKYLKNQEHL